MVTNYFLISDSLPRLLNEVQCLSLNLYESTLHLTALNKRWLTKSRNSSSILFHDGPGECWTVSPGTSIKIKVKVGVVKVPGAVGLHVEKRSVLEKVTLPAPDVLLPWLQPKKVNERKAHWQLLLLRHELTTSLLAGLLQPERRNSCQGREQERVRASSGQGIADIGWRSKC